ncbi:MAG: hypothetical protein A2Z14_02105 [Chloroflexi bacterium RBG_16_48_8]|nr:MAG: hypothetical protein A2Z14_02105 [Chloroflexi bacterium RBG_16_48_8]
MSKSSQKPPVGGHVQIQLPGTLEPIYANFALITNSPSEIVIDLAQILPRTSQALIKARVIMTPTNAKALYQALEGHLKKYEEKYGEIRLPQNPTLADELFRSLSSSQDPGEE